MPKPANIVITYRDEKGAEGQTIVNIPNQDELDLEEMIALAEEHVYSVHRITEAGIIRVSIIVDVDFPAEYEEIESGSDLEAGAEFIFKADNGFTSQIRIPAFWGSYFLSGSPEVDLTASAVQDFIDHVLDDDLTTSRGEDLTTLASSKKSFQRMRV